MPLLYSYRLRYVDGLQIAIRLIIYYFYLVYSRKLDLPYCFMHHPGLLSCPWQEFYREHPPRSCKYLLDWPFMLPKLIDSSWTIGSAILALSVPQKRLARAMGYTSLGMSLGMLVAPCVGGVVFDRLGYNALFGVTYVLISLDVVFRVLLLEPQARITWTPSHPERPVVSDIYRLRTYPRRSTPDSHKRRDRLPALISLLFFRRTLAALFCSAIQAALLSSFDSVLVIRAANLFHWTSTKAGLLFLSLAMPSFMAPLSGWVCDRMGPKYPAFLGFALACPGLVCLRLVVHDARTDRVLLCTLLGIIGLTLSFTFPSLMTEIAAIVQEKAVGMAGDEQRRTDSKVYAQAYALYNISFAAGCTIGPLISGSIAQAQGWATMSWTLGLLSGCAAITSLLWIGGPLPWSPARNFSAAMNNRWSSSV